MRHQALSSGRRILLQLLRVFGVLVFIWILLRIDRLALFQIITRANLLLIVLALGSTFLSYGCKAMRWHLLQHAAGLKPDLRASWRTYMIGIFLSVVTPGKVGDLGRAAYLKHAGASLSVALAITFADRILDIATIATLAALSVWWLWGVQAGLIAGSSFLGILLVGYIAWRHGSHIVRRLVPQLSFPTVDTKSLSLLFVSTVCGWVLYFVWAILLAYAIGIMLPVATLIAIITIAGIVALIPISPSGFGTRDAALITLLAPYNIPSEGAVALAFLMFSTIVISALPGLWEWLRNPARR
ncbi:hypothetical protein A3D88_01565 [Candidatus Peribacteria bacterium RIFCSPHIGHO2_02_FULL_52_16]|nr:MAG: hypothetical protein A2706_03805 [Candidatus Peribacteria bacterium RIFCSPHIGHO2_01_FULL_51_35]OGJ61008.1 MAG: hypothetical protein A3D88_01565 [Candidatus Peribacteria bacterium RIFCSPHIGHO2_02_FULL_52_16]